MPKLSPNWRWFCCGTKIEFLILFVGIVAWVSSSSITLSFVSQGRRWHDSLFCNELTNHLVFTEVNDTYMMIWPFANCIRTLKLNQINFFGIRSPENNFLFFEFELLELKLLDRLNTTESWLITEQILANFRSQLLLKGRHFGEKIFFQSLLRPWTETKGCVTKIPIFTLQSSEYKKKWLIMMQEKSFWKTMQDLFLDLFALLFHSWKA